MLKIGSIAAIAAVLGACSGTMPKQGGGIPSAPASGSSVSKAPAATTHQPSKPQPSTPQPAPLPLLPGETREEYLAAQEALQKASFEYAQCTRVATEFFVTSSESAAVIADAALGYCADKRLDLADASRRMRLKDHEIKRMLEENDEKLRKRSISLILMMRKKIE